MVTVKYCLIILRADDEGEGGTFALFSLLSRYANIVRRDPREEQMVRMERHTTHELGKPAQRTRNLMERSRFLQWMLKIIGVFGVALVMSDGVLTPAQSVLGAIQASPLPLRLFLVALLLVCHVPSWCSCSCFSLSV